MPRLGNGMPLVSTATGAPVLAVQDFFWLNDISGELTPIHTASRTNLSANPCTAWGVTYVTKDLNATTSPDGTENAKKITATSTSQPRTETAAVAVPAIDTTYTFSVFVKKGNTPYIALARFSGSQNAIFNLDTKSIVSSNTENATIEEISNGWFKISITQTALAAEAYNLWKINLTDGSTYSTGVIGEYMYIWGGQIEELSYATSYIPTSGSTVTRDAETCNSAGTAQDFNSEEGVLYAEINLGQADSVSRYIGVSDGSTNNRAILGVEADTTSIYYYFTDGGSGQVSSNSALSDISIFNKVAIKWKLNDFALWLNGVEVATDASGTVPAAGTFDRLLFTSGASTQYFYGKCKAIKVYKEALSDAELIALTT